MGAGCENIPAWGHSGSFVPTQLDVTETWDGFGKVRTLSLPARGLSMGTFSAHLSALNFWSSPINDPSEYQLSLQLGFNIFIYAFSAIITDGLCDEYTCAHISK